MAYKIENINVITETTEIGLGVAVRPGNTLFSPIYSSDEQTKENLKTLLLTRIGERYMQPTFGTNLLNVIFEPNLSEIKTEIADLITGPISYWLPYINIVNIIIITAEDDPSLDHDVKLTLEYSIGGVETNTITIIGDESNIAVS